MQDTSYYPPCTKKKEETAKTISEKVNLSLYVDFPIVAPINLY